MADNGRMLVLGASCHLLSVHTRTKPVERTDSGIFLVVKTRGLTLLIPLFRVSRGERNFGLDYLEKYN